MWSETDIQYLLLADEAPISVANFLTLRWVTPLKETVNSDPEDRDEG